jgi:anti-anti-sigma factor
VLNPHRAEEYVGFGRWPAAGERRGTPGGVGMSDAPVASPVLIETTDTAVVVRVNIKLLDDMTLRHMDELIDKAACGRPGVDTIVIDMSSVQIMPSLGLGVLLQLTNKYKERRQQLKLAGLQPQVRTTLTITKLDKIFTVEETVEAALM